MSESLRECLLKETLAYLYSESAFYRDRHGDVLKNAHNPDEFAKLRPLSKTELLDNLWRIRVSSEFPFHVGLSGGTTADKHDGKLAIYMRERDEVEFSRNLIWKLDGLRPRPLALRLFHAHHGALFHSSLPGTFMMPLETEYHFSQIKALLTSSLDFKDCASRISILIGPSNYCKLLYCLCARDGALPELSINQIIGGGDRITPRWRRILECGFAARIVESYGLSEVLASIAPQCPDCGFFHFKQTVYPELEPLHPDADGAGLGEIILTSLLPTTVHLPLLRYRTGDIARTHGQCDKAGELSYEILGRLSDSHVARDPSVCLPSGVIEDIIDDLPWIERRAFQSGQSFGLSGEIALPQFRFETSDDGGVILVLKSAIRFPRLHAEALRRDCDAVEQRLCEELGRGRVVLSGTRLTVRADTW